MHRVEPIISDLSMKAFNKTDAHCLNWMSGGWGETCKKIAYLILAFCYISL